VGDRTKNLVCGQNEAAEGGNFHVQAAHRDTDRLGPRTAPTLETDFLVASSVVRGAHEKTPKKMGVLVESGVRSLLPAAPLAPAPPSRTHDARTSGLAYCHTSRSLLLGWFASAQRHRVPGRLLFRRFCKAVPSLSAVAAAQPIA
jgi:hypothetical protein